MVMSAIGASIASVLGAGLNFLSNLFIARYFGNEAYADFSVVFSLSTILAVILSLGFGQTLLMTLPLLSENNSRAKIANYNSAISVLCILASPIFLYYLMYLGFGLYTSLVVVLTGYLACLSLIKQAAYYSQEKLVEYQLIDKLIKNSSFIFLLMIGYYAGFNSTFFLVVCFATSYLLLNAAAAVLSPGRKLAVMKLGMLKRSELDWSKTLPLYLTLLLTTFLSNLDLILLKELAGKNDIAIYAAASKFSMIGNIFIISLTAAVTPRLVKYNVLDKAKAQSSATVSAVIASASMMFYLVFIYFHGEFLLNMFGEEYVAGKIILLLLVVSVLMNCIFGQTATLMKVKDETVYLIGYLGGALLLKLVLSVILYQKMGSSGVAVSTVICVVFWNILCLMHLRIKFKINTSVFSAVSLWKK